MSFPELTSYDGRRYQSFLPSCYGGVEIGRRQGGCLRDLARRASEWSSTNGAFLREPPEQWYRIVREMRALASLHGHDPDQRCVQRRSSSESNSWPTPSMACRVSSSPAMTT